MLVRRGRSQNDSVPEVICPANFGEPVFVNVYYLHWSNGLKTGAYHTGTVVYDQEYGYGGHPFSSSGIFQMDPKDTAMLGDGISFKESLFVGNTYLSRDAVQRVLISMSDEYTGDAYHLLNFNCNTFTAQFIQLLCHGVLPKWVTLLSRFVSGLPFIESILPVQFLRPALLSMDLEDGELSSEAEADTEHRDERKTCNCTTHCMQNANRSQQNGSVGEKKSVTSSSETSPMNGTLKSSGSRKRTLPV